jgi:putative transposase
VRRKVIALALDEPDLSARKVAVALTDRQHCYVSEASVYRLLKAEGPLTSPAVIVVNAAERFAIRRLRSISCGTPTSPI